MNIENILIQRISKLLDTMDRFPVKDYPSDISNYMPDNPLGEFLIKTQGYNSTAYLDSNSQMNLLEIGQFPINQHYIRIDIIFNEGQKQEELIELTGEVTKYLNDNFTLSDICEAGRLKLVNVGEPMVDEEKGFQFRVLIYSIIIVEYN